MMINCWLGRQVSVEFIHFPLPFHQFNWQITTWHGWRSFTTIRVLRLISLMGSAPLENSLMKFCEQIKITPCASCEEKKPVTMLDILYLDGDYRHWFKWIVRSYLYVRDCVRKSSRKHDNGLLLWTRRQPVKTIFMISRPVPITIVRKLINPQP